MKIVNIMVAVDESHESMRACEWACNGLLLDVDIDDDNEQNDRITLHIVSLMGKPYLQILLGRALIPNPEVLPK
ncbi:hypothetical protein SUGI_0451650 [Cryptomeria japonica]|nr:hypothetical protein SUGI_0451650 [Cryptomeria japonica]